MKKRLPLLTTLFLLAAVSNAFAAPTYRLHDLGTMGFKRSYASGINNHGVIVGTAVDSPDPAVEALAFKWRRGQREFLYFGEAGVTDYTSARAINDKNEVVGAGKDYRIRRPGPTMWHSDGRFDSLPAPYFGSATDINKHSQMTVDVGDEIGFNSGVVENGEWRSLDPPEGYRHATPNAINDSGQIVGRLVAMEAQDYSAFLFEDDTFYNLNDLVTNGYSKHLATAVDINNSGQIIGNDYLFENGEVTALGFSNASAINDLGQVVGGNHLYENGNLLNLNDLIQTEVIYSGLELVDLNNSGQMVGSAIVDGTRHAVYLDPVPIPAAAWMLGSGLIGLACLRSRNHRCRNRLKD